MSGSVRWLRRAWQRVRRRALAGLSIYEELYTAPYRSQIRRELRNERDMLFLIACTDVLGIPNPVAFYTLELYPEVLDQWHEWHQRLGMPSAPDGGFRCC